MIPRPFVHSLLVPLLALGIVVSPVHAADFTLLPSTSGTLRNLRFSGGDIEVAPVGTDMQSSYFNTTGTDREWRRGFAEFAVPMFRSQVDRSILHLTVRSVVMGPDFHLVDTYPGDLTIAVDDYFRPGATVGSIEADGSLPPEVFDLDVTDAVRSAQGSALGIRVRMIIEGTTNVIQTFGATFVGQGEPNGPTIDVSLVPLPLAFDLMPRSCPNRLNPNARGSVRAVLFGTADVPAPDIDPATVLLAGVPPVSSDIRDTGAPAPRSTECECVSAGHDGIEDLGLSFDGPALAAAIGPLNPNESRLLHLQGRLRDGTPFQAADCVVGQGGRGAKAGSIALRASSSPASGTQRVVFSLRSGGNSRVMVFDVVGRLVRTVFQGYRGPGEHIVDWSANGLANGVYLYRIESGPRQATAKFVLVR